MNTSVSVSSRGDRTISLSRSATRPRFSIRRLLAGVETQNCAVLLADHPIAQTGGVGVLPNGACEYVVHGTVGRIVQSDDGCRRWRCWSDRIAATVTLTDGSGVIQSVVSAMRLLCFRRRTFAMSCTGCRWLDFRIRWRSIGGRQLHNGMVLPRRIENSPVRITTKSETGLLQGKNRRYCSHARDRVTSTSIFLDCVLPECPVSRSRLRASLRSIGAVRSHRSYHFELVRCSSSHVRPTDRAHCSYMYNDPHRTS